MTESGIVVKSGILMLLAALLWAMYPLSAVAQPQVARNIHVDLSHVDPNLPCTVVGERTHVRFDARAVAFRPNRVELLLNGTPATSTRVRYAWPEVTLDGGLLAGRNTVELIAHRKDGSAVERRIVIKVGNSVHSSDGITLGCTGVEDQSAAVVSTVVPQTSAPVVEYATPAVPTVVYSARPVYTGWNWPYARGWFGAPFVGGYYSGWAPAALSIGVGFGWHHAWGGWHHRRHGGWHGNWSGRRHHWHHGHRGRRH